MDRTARVTSQFGCLLSVLGPLVAIVLYPRARWLVAFALVGIAVLVLNGLFRRKPSALDVAEHAQRLLEGTGAAWDVDDYEHLNPQDRKLHELWSRTMVIYLPEKWPQLDERRKTELRNIIQAMRDLGAAQK